MGHLIDVVNQPDSEDLGDRDDRPVESVPTLPEPDPWHQEDRDNRAILEQVTLDSLSASQTTILPFEATTLHWQVSGPEGITVSWGDPSDPVTLTGARTVSPTHTFTYSLFAHLRRSTRLLGQVTVAVDTTICRLIQIPYDFAGDFLEALFDIKLEEISEEEDDWNLRLRTTTFGGRVWTSRSTTIDASGFAMKLPLTVDINNRPDAKVDIDIKWTYVVRNGDMQTKFERLNVGVSFPWYAWGIPGAVIALPIIIGNAKDLLRRMITDTVTDFSRWAITFATPEGFRLHSIQFKPEWFEFEWCPAPSPESRTQPPAERRGSGRL